MQPTPTTADDRFALGPIQNPVRAFLHGPAAFVSLGFGFHFGALAALSPERRTTLVVFALSQFALYTASTLYHAVPWSARWKHRMQRLDHSMIYVKIAGTLTPLAWIALADPLRVSVLLGVWAIAVAGIAQKALFPALPPLASVPLQLTQALLGLPALFALLQGFPAPAGALAASGAALYGVGLYCFLRKRPRLWPRVFSHHEVFHVLVVAGSASHYALALAYLA